MQENLPTSVAVVFLCFVCFALTTSNHLSPNLSSLSFHLHLSPRITGLTLLSLGNATPDIFTTYTALDSHSTGLAMGELLGSANFVICVVFCSMGFMTSAATEVNTNRAVILRDILVFGVFVCVTVGFLVDSKLWDYESVLMIFGYLIYVAFVVYSGDEQVEDDIEDVISVADVRSLKISEVFQVWRGKFDKDVEVGSNDGSLRRIKSANELVIPRPLLLARSTSSNAVMYRGQEQGYQSILDNNETDNDDFIDNEQIRTFTPEPTPVLEIPHILINDQYDETTELIQHESSSNQTASLLKSIIFYLLPQEHDAISIILAPLIICFNLLIPTIPRHYIEHEAHFQHQLRFRSMLLRIQTLIIPIFLKLTLFNDENGFTLFYSLIASIILTSSTFLIPSRYFIPFLGFITSLLVILITSTHLIEHLLIISEILQIPHSLLGLTVLTIGNSIGDLVANLTLAKLGHVDIAMGACVGGPLSYIVLGLGLNGIIVIIKNFAKKDAKRWIELDIDYHFMISFVFLLVMVLILVGIALIKELKGTKNNESFLNWKIGLFGISWWIIGICVQILAQLKNLNR